MRIKSVRRRPAAGLVLAAACVFGLAARAPAQEEGPVVRVEAELVNLNVVVTDRQGRRVGGLKREDFEVYEEDARQEITHFAAGERPLKLVLLFDTSVSMIEVLPGVKREADRLLDGLRPDDEVTVLSFASVVRRHSGWVGKERGREVVASLTPEEHPEPRRPSVGHPGYNVGDGNTYLYDAFKHVFDNFRADDDRLAVIMFSDGVDTGAGRSISRIRRRADDVGKEVRRQAEESWALVYPIRYKTKQLIGYFSEPAWRPTGVIRLGKGPEDPGRELFSRIARATGGEVFEWETQQDLAATVQEVLKDLRSQYGLAYRPPRAGSRGDFRRVKVRLKQPNLVVRARQGYRVPE